MKEQENNKYGTKFRLCLITLKAKVNITKKVVKNQNRNDNCLALEKFYGLAK